MKHITYNARKITKVLIFLLCVTSYTLYAARVFAQQVSLSITPPHLEAIIKPSKAILIAHRIENFGDPVVLKARVLPFSSKGERGEIVVKEEFEGPVRFSLDNADIQLEQPFFLQTRQSQQLLLRIRIPEGAPQGDYYYTFFVETQPTAQTEGVSTSHTQARVGSTILLTVTDTGQLEIKPKITLFDTLARFKLPFVNARIFDSNDKIPVVLTAQNNGRNLIKPEGKITLRGNFGEKASYEITPENILAGGERLLVATPTAEIDCQTQKSTGQQPIYCQRPVSVLLSGFFVGVYQLSTEIKFGEGSPQVSASTSFVAIPFKLLLGLIAVVFVAIILVRRNKKQNT